MILSGANLDMKATKLTAKVIFTCPNLNEKIGVDLFELDIKQNVRQDTADVEVYCKCGNFHTLETEHAGHYCKPVWG